MKKYSRQLKFLNQFLDINENLEKFQKEISRKKLIIVGCGGVGSPLTELLIRGGFLNLILVDNDLIDETNIGRQIFFEKDIGKLKSKILKKYLLKINSKANIEVICDILDNKNIFKICKNSNLIIDCSDNFITRKIINNYCEKNKKDWIYTGAVKSEIMCCLFKGKDRLFSKVFSNKIIDETCCNVGVLASTTFTSASFAYNQILKYFLNIHENNLIKLDLWDNKLYKIKIK